MTRGLIICATPRSGSYLACDLLWSTGNLGKPREFATPSDEVGWRAFGHNVYYEYSNSVLDNHKSSNDFFSIKFMRFQFLQFIGMTGKNPSPMSEMECLRRYIDEGEVQLIYLRRRDRISQSVSWALARKYGLWSSFDPMPVRDAFELSDRELLSAWEFIRAEYMGWDHFFQRTPSRPKVLDYEDWNGSPREFVGAIASLCGLSIPDNISLKVARTHTPDVGQKALGQRLAAVLATTANFDDGDPCGEGSRNDTGVEP